VHASAVCLVCGRNESQKTLSDPVDRVRKLITMSKAPEKTLAKMVLADAEKIKGFKLASNWLKDQEKYNGTAEDANSKASKSAKFRYDFATGVFGALETNAEAIKSEKLKVAEFAETVCRQVGVGFKTIKNFKPVVQLERSQAIKSLDLFGLQGTISTTKKFGFLDAPAVNAICMETAKKLGETAVEGSARHLIKLATDTGARNPNESPAKILADSYALCVTDSDGVIERFKAPEKKTEDQLTIERLNAELETLKADLKAVRAENQALREAMPVEKIQVVKEKKVA